MLRKVILSMMATGVLTAQADSFSFLTIEKTDGTAQSLTAVGLTINYSNGNLVATNGTQSATIALTDISRMYFSNEQAITSAISTVNTSTPTSETNPQSDGIYNLQGHRVASLSQRSSLRKGIYIIVENGQTKKVQVK
jgi:hypothetical protein